MTITLNIYKKGQKYIESCWDKHNGYELNVGNIENNDMVRITYHNTYATLEGVKRAFNRQVKLLGGN